MIESQEVRRAHTRFEVVVGATAWYSIELLQTVSEVQTVLLRAEHAWERNWVLLHEEQSVHPVFVVREHGAET